MPTVKLASHAIDVIRKVSQDSSRDSERRKTAAVKAVYLEASVTLSTYHEDLLKPGKKITELTGIPVACVRDLLSSRSNLSSALFMNRVTMRDVLSACRIR